MISGIRSMSKPQRSAAFWLVVLALCAGFIAGYAASAAVKHKIEYIDKVKFCHDRMTNDTIRHVWRKQYCGKVKLNAVDPITGKPVAGIVEGE